MKYSCIYENGKVKNFFIKIDNYKEFQAILKPYFLTTSYDNTRKGNIIFMECLFSSEVWYGKQKHGYGYSCSDDVYRTLIDIILKLYKNQLTNEEINELNNINTSNSNLVLSNDLIEHLIELNYQEATRY